MRHIPQRFSRLSRTRQVALIAALVGVLAVFMPWNTIGQAELGNEHAFSGLADQNFIIGVITFGLLFYVVLFLGLPLLGLRGLRSAHSDSTVLTFLGGEATLVTFISLIQHTTSLARVVNENIQAGLYLAFIASIVVLMAGYFLRREQPLPEPTLTEPFHVPRRHTLDDLRSESSTTPTASNSPKNEREPRAAPSAEDRRMKLDL